MGAGREETRELSDAGLLAYLIFSTLILLPIPSMYLRAALSPLLLMILFSLRGFNYNLGTPRGLVASSSMALTMTLPFILFANISYSGASFLEILPMIPWHISVALWEECLYRGPILRYSSRKFILSSILFSLIHSQNPGFGVLPFIGIFLAGIFLCSLRVRLGLLPSISFHASWNLFLEHLWGFPTSGIRGVSLFSSEPAEIFLITGGDFGPEGSVLALVEFSFASLALLRSYFRKTL